MHPTRRLKDCLDITAFTLIELTIVSAIMLTLLGMSMPLLQKTFFDLTAKDTGFTVSKIASFAQAQSVMDGIIYKMVFDFDAGAYRLFELHPSEKGPAVDKPAHGIFGKLFRLPKGLSFRESEDSPGGFDPGAGRTKTLLFYPDGHCDNLDIEVIDKRLMGYRIIVKGFGNLVHVQEVTHA